MPPSRSNLTPAWADLFTHLRETTPVEQNEDEEYEEYEEDGSLSFVDRMRCEEGVSNEELYEEYYEDEDEDEDFSKYDFLYPEDDENALEYSDTVYDAHHGDISFLRDQGYTNFQVTVTSVFNDFFDEVGITPDTICDPDTFPWDKLRVACKSAIPDLSDSYIDNMFHAFRASSTFQPHDVESANYYVEDYEKYVMYEEDEDEDEDGYDFREEMMNYDEDDVDVWNDADLTNQEFKYDDTREPDQWVSFCQSYFSKTSELNYFIS